MVFNRYWSFAICVHNIDYFIIIITIDFGVQYMYFEIKVTTPITNIICFFY
jgi:hypothetical protein